MLYHIRLKKAISYDGAVSATRQEPDVYISDKDVLNAAVNSGYFDLVEIISDQSESEVISLESAGGPSEDGGIPARFDRSYLESLSVTDLKKLANDLGVTVAKSAKKDDLVSAISAETVTVPADDEAQPDFGED